MGVGAPRAGNRARMRRHYDRIGLVSPSARTAGGYREYSEDELQRLFHVEGLRSLGLSLAQIAEVIDDRAFSPAALVERLIDRTREQIAQAQDLIGRLERVRSTEPQSWSDVLRTIGLVRGFAAANPSQRQQLALTLERTDQRDVPVLVDAMLREPSEDAAGALQWAIARIGDAAIPALAAALPSAEGDRCRRAFDALVKIGTPAAHEVIMAQADHRDPRIRGHAILVRARHGEPDALLGLVDLIRAGRHDVEASDALVELATSSGLIPQALAAITVALGGAEPGARRRLMAARSEFPVSAAPAG